MKNITLLALSLIALNGITNQLNGKGTLNNIETAIRCPGGFNIETIEEDNKSFKQCVKIENTGEHYRFALGQRLNPQSLIQNALEHESSYIHTCLMLSKNPIGAININQPLYALAVAFKPNLRKYSAATVPFLLNKIAQSKGGQLIFLNNGDALERELLETCGVTFEQTAPNEWIGMYNAVKAK